MGKKNSRRLKLLLLVCAFIGLKVLSMAASYTSATIFNPASMKVTDQGSALIAVRLPSEEVCFPGNVARGQVVNNMGGSLYLSLNSAGRYTRVEIRPQELSAGRAADLSLTAPGESTLFTGEILARWKNGSAEIPFSIDIRVIAVSYTHLSPARKTEMTKDQQVIEHNIDQVGHDIDTHRSFCITGTPQNTIHDHRNNRKGKGTGRNSEISGADLLYIRLDVYKRQVSGNKGYFHYQHHLLRDVS